MNPILARFQDQPAFIEESYSGWLEGCLAAVAARLGEIEMGGASEDFWGSDDRWYRPYIVRNGVLHVPVKGVLLNDFPYAFGNWATGYEYIWRAVKRGLDDGAVKGIALVIDSGGGMVAGNFDLVDRIFASRGKKPIHAFAAEHAYSAAYNIASSAQRVTVARTGGVGSIGVVVTHFEYSQMLEDAGIRINIIRSKPGKMEGNPYEALSDGARERIQERVDEFHGQFVAMVARNRGMSVKAVDDTGALTFMAQKAIGNGLADEIGSLDDAITAFEATFSEGEDQMADITQADIDAAVSTAVAAAKPEHVKEGSTAAVARINAIIGCENAKDRPTAALSAALDTEMTVEQANTFLGKLAAEVKPAAQQPGAGVPKELFTAAMERGNPGIDAEGAEVGDKEMSRVEEALLLTKGPRKPK